MKILFLNIYQTNVARGSEVFVTEIAQRLNKNGDTAAVISGNATEQKRWPLLWRFYIDPDGLHILWFTLKNLLTIIKGNFDVIIPLNGGWQAAIVRLLTWIMRKKMVIVGQSGIGWDDKNNLYCFPDCFIALSTEARKWAESVNPSVRTRYIPNGCDTSKFIPQGKQYKHGLSHPVILCVAALVQSKNIDKTIQAVSKIPNASLLIVGKGPLKKELELLCEDLLGTRYKIIHSPFTEMPDIYRSADCFTLVSDYSEAFGNVYAEALASNLPVIATDDAKRREIVGPAGEYVKINQISAYAERIIHVLHKKWGDTPRKQAKNYDWDIIAQTYQRLFKSL